MAILIACEESQEVCRAFRQQGIEAYSCDLLPCSGNHPEWHIQKDIQKILDTPWEMIIAFPPCTDLSASGARYWASKKHDGRQLQSIRFFMQFAMHPCPYICIENPVGIISTFWRQPDQIIQPWQYGHGEVKTTCLWLKGLPLLQPTAIVAGRQQRIWRMGQKKGRALQRSKTFPGIAQAMAEQWAPLLRQQGKE